MITVNTRLEDLYALGYLTKQCYTWSVDTRSWQTLGDVVRETSSPNGLKRVTGATPLRVGSLLLCLGRMRFVPLTDKVARNFTYLEDGSVRLLRDLFDETAVESGREALITGLFLDGLNLRGLLLGDMAGFDDMLDGVEQALRVELLAFCHTFVSRVVLELVKGGVTLRAMLPVFQEVERELSTRTLTIRWREWDTLSPLRLRSLEEGINRVIRTRASRPQYAALRKLFPSYRDWFLIADLRKELFIRHPAWRGDSRMAALFWSELLPYVTDVLVGLLDQTDRDVEANRLLRDFPIKEEEKTLARSFFLRKGHLPMLYLVSRVVMASRLQSDQVFVRAHGIDGGHSHPEGGNEKEGGWYYGHRDPARTTVLWVRKQDFSAYEELLSRPFLLIDGPEIERLRESEELRMPPLGVAALLAMEGRLRLVRVRGEWFLVSRALLGDLNLVHLLSEIERRWRRGVSLETLLGKEAAAPLVLFVRKVAERTLGAEFDASGKIVQVTRLVDLPSALRELLARKRRAMSLIEVMDALTARWPGLEWRGDRVRSALLAHPEIVPYGKRGLYGLISWEGEFSGTVADLVARILSQEGRPMRVTEIARLVREVIPDCKPETIRNSIRGDLKRRFVFVRPWFYTLREDDGTVC